MVVLGHRTKEIPRKTNLLRSTFNAHYPRPELFCIFQSGAIPGQVLASHPNASYIPIKLVQVAKVVEHDITDVVIF